MTFTESHRDTTSGSVLCQGYNPLGLVAGDLLGGFEKGSTTCNLRFPPDIGVLDPFRSHRFLLKLAMGPFFTGRKTARW